jgi:peptidoglycan-N-acetylglucosamine deacetylase
VRTAGIAWSAAGYEVAVLDGAGRPAGPPVRYPADRVGELITGLGAVGDLGAVVVESTNGLVDARLAAAGLPVYRADPAGLPERPLLGSVDARVLAARARTAAGTLTPITTGEGTLTGRTDELAAGIRRAATVEAEMAAAGRCLSHGDRGGNQIALTFDDGPNPPYTNAVLDVLERYGVPATIFCVGLHASVFDQEVSRIAEQRHVLGNHTWSHPFLPDLTAAQLREQIVRTNAACRASGGNVSRFFRPPYGSRSPELLEWLAGNDVIVTLWDVEPLDWTCPGAQAIADAVLTQARPGSIVLLHDGGGDRSQTVQALPTIIEGLLERGYEFATVDALAAGREHRRSD